MQARHLLQLFFQDLDLLLQILQESPYVGHDERVHLQKEMLLLKEQLGTGEISVLQGEKHFAHLQKKAVLHELERVTKKVRLLNPASPRLEGLLSIRHALQNDQLTAKEARKKLLSLMHLHQRGH